MSFSPADVARALRDLSRTMPEGDLFLKSVRRELSKYVQGEVVTVTITTPSGQSGSLAEEVQRMLAERLHHPIEIVEKADPTLLGGAVISFGDEQIDLSVRGSLQQLSGHIASSSSQPKP